MGARLNRITLLQKLMLLLIAFVIGLSGVAVTALTTINYAKLGGEKAIEIQKGNDLLADILPPPLYVLEAWSVVNALQGETNASTIDASAKKLQKLRADFDARMAYWRVNQHDAEKSSLLYGDVERYAKSFYERALTSYLAAVRSGNRSAIAQEIAILMQDEGYQRDAIEKITKLVSEDSSKLHKDVEAHVVSKVRLTYAVIMAVTILYVGFFILIIRSIRADIGGEPSVAREIMARLANGDTTVSINVGAGDDSSLFSAMRDALEQAVANARVRAALDTVATNVMIADADLNVIYTNESIEGMLRTAESEIRKDLPNFTASKVMGSNIDIFHKNPSHQRRMLGELRQTHRTKLKIGERSFSLILNPIFGHGGDRLGTVVEWQDLTAQLAAEAAELQRFEIEAKLSEANARIRAALDNVTTNVMIADNNRDIIYMNRSVSEMLVVAESDIRKALPNFDARKLVGANIDVFHKNPAHQRDMLANLRTTHRTQIVVGGRTFSLIANPVFGPDGARLGSVVEWKDRTEEVRVESEVGDIVTGASNGDFTRRIALEGKEGFFRQLGEGINQLVNTSEQGLKDIGTVLEALSRGDLTRLITADYQGTFGQLKDYSNNTVTSLTQMLLQIREASETINTAANEIAAGNADLSSRTEQQASNLEETASSMEELTSTVKQNSDNAKQANQLAVTASGVAQKGGAVVQDVVVTMAAINDSARKIADIISVIDGIAFQTNILALNAAVEAARAGEQGRGFAVVAAEVRNLAQRSASAAKEIKTLITDSVEKVDDGNKLVSEAGTTMQEIVQAIKRVTDLMSEIAAASEEQSSGIEQINTAVTQMDEMTQQNAALVEEASAAAESLREQADTLSQSVGVFVLASGEGVAPSTMLRALPRQAAKPSAMPKPNAPKAKLTKLKAAKSAKPVDDEWDEF